MEEYKNIIKLINDKLAENERTIEYYREETKRFEEIITSLEAENKKLQEKISKSNL